VFLTLILQLLLACPKGSPPWVGIRQKIWDIFPVSVIPLWGPTPHKSIAKYGLKPIKGKPKNLLAM